MNSMLLEPQDVELVFKLHWALMFFVNQRLKVISDDLASPAEFSSLSPETRREVRDAFLQHTCFLSAFVEENPAHLTNDELDIVRSWQHIVHGRFYVFRQLKKYMVFLSTEEQAIAYGVLALSQPFEELVGPYLPVLTQTVLLPFKGVIVYDGLMSSYRISFGPGIRRSLNESFKEAKARHGIVTSLPMSTEPLLPKMPTAQAGPETADQRREGRGRTDRDRPARPVLQRASERRVCRVVPKAGRKTGPQSAPRPCFTGVRMPGQAASCEPWAASTFCTTRARRRTCGPRTSTTLSTPAQAAERRSWQRFASCSGCTRSTTNGHCQAAWTTIR